MGEPRRRFRRVSGPDLRARLSHDLPRHIGTALAAYDGFAAGEAGEDAKAFAAHHTACKAALAHVDMLIKLLRWAEGEGGGAEETGETDVTVLLARARAALGQDGEDMEDDDTE